MRGRIASCGRFSTGLLPLSSRPKSADEIGAQLEKLPHN
jgi:hypothetical protein